MDGRDKTCSNDATFFENYLITCLLKSKNVLNNLNYRRLFHT